MGRTVVGNGLINQQRMYAYTLLVLINFYFINGNFSVYEKVT